MGPNNIIQDSLSDSSDIIFRIKAELKKARSEILVAMAWFTDNELLDILLEKANEGLSISLIMADHEDNNKLDFSLLENQAKCEVIKIKNVGYGMMHQKFCILDRTTLINGSYNWSKNAKNNHENVIVTNFPKTVEEFIKTFFNIKNRAIKIMNGTPIDEINDELPSTEIPEKVESQPLRQLSVQEQSFYDFKNVLDNIIATEVGSIDRDMIRTGAYNRAKENNGDHQVLPQAMDSLYSNFINEIEVVAERKTRLKGKIEEQFNLSKGNFELNIETEINNKKNTHTKEINNIEENKTLLENQIEKSKILIESNTNTKIPFIKSQIEKINQKINEHKLDFVKPPVNKAKSIVLGLLLVFLALYIFVFYSSVAYIFMFSTEDANNALQSSGIIKMPEVFNPHAITNIWKKGLGGILFLFLFVAIPLALGMYEYISNVTDDDTKIITKNNEEQNIYQTIESWFKKNLGFIFILIVDIFIAYKVSININKIENLINRKETHELTFIEILGSSNFWLVFVLGTLGIFLFSKVFNKTMYSVNKRSLTHQQAFTKQIIQNLENDINLLESQINEIKTQNDELNAQIAIAENDISRLRHQIQNLPLQHAEQIRDLNQSLNSYSEKILNLANIYINQIENDKLPVSRSEMENRCNIFMEGWSRYLYEFYAVNLAETKTADAIREVENWLNNLKGDPKKSIEPNYHTAYNYN